jgi:iron complex transport system substrate-binding protein
MKTLCTCFVAFLALVSAAQAQRVVTLGGDVTEIVFALDRQRDLVCTDQTSTYPAAAAKLPQVGYLRNLSAEGVLSCKPDLIIAAADAGPDAAMRQLAVSGIRIVKVPRDDTVDAVRQKIRIVSDALASSERGKNLLSHFDARMAATNASLVAYKDRPRAIFLMAHGPGGAMAAGTGTAANAMLTLAHANNAATGFHGYKPLTPEAAIALKPDVVVIDEMSLKALGGMAAFKARPEIAATPAAKAGRIAAIDTMFVLGFGPRAPEAIAALAALLHRNP